MLGTRIEEVNGGRTFLIDSTNRGLPNSMFIVEIGGVGLVLEFDRHEVVAALKSRFDLCENWDAGFSNLLAA